MTSSYSFLKSKLLIINLLPLVTALITFVKGEDYSLDYNLNLIIIAYIEEDMLNINTIFNLVVGAFNIDIFSLASIIGAFNLSTFFIANPLLLL